MTILNKANVANGGTFTPSAGTNRRVIWNGWVRRNTGTPGWSANLSNGTTNAVMTLDANTTYFNDDQFCCFSLTEANIPTGSNLTFVVVPTGGTVLGTPAGVMFTVNNRNQTIALDSGFTSNGNIATATSITINNETNNANSILLSIIRNSAQDGVTPPANWTIDQDTSQITAALSAQHRDDAPAGTSNLTFTGSSSTTWFWQLVSYQAAATVVVNKPFKIYANGAIQANVFTPNVALPPGVVLRFGANNVLQSNGLITQSGTGKFKIQANGQLICNNTIIV